MLKNLSKWTIVNGCATLLALVGTILAIVSNGVGGYAFTTGPVVLLTILGTVASCGATVLGEKFGLQHIFTTICKLAAVALISFGLVFIVTGRVDVATNLFTWDNANVAAAKAFYTGVVGAVLLLVATIAEIVTSFNN